MYVCMYVCVYFMYYVSSSHMARVRIKRIRLPILLSWSAEQGKIIFRSPHSPQRTRSRETGSAVLSRASLLISIILRY